MNTQAKKLVGEEQCLPKQPPRWRNWLILAVAIGIYFIFTQISIPGLSDNGTKSLGFVIAVIVLLLF